MKNQQYHLAKSEKDAFVRTISREFPMLSDIHVEDSGKEIKVIASFPKQVIGHNVMLDMICLDGMEFRLMKCDGVPAGEKGTRSVFCCVSNIKGAVVPYMDHNLYTPSTRRPTIVADGFTELADNIHAIGRYFSAFSELNPIEDNMDFVEETFESYRKKGSAGSY